MGFCTGLIARQRRRCVRNIVAISLEPLRARYILEWLFICKWVLKSTQVNVHWDHIAEREFIRKQLRNSFTFVIVGTQQMVLSCNERQYVRICTLISLFLPLSLILFSILSTISTSSLLGRLIFHIYLNWGNIRTGYSRTNVLPKEDYYLNATDIYKEILYTFFCSILYR